MVIQNQEFQEVTEYPGTEKVRSMLQIQKALREETYEACAFWINRASVNGATKREIAWLLRHPSWHLEEDRTLN